MHGGDELIEADDTEVVVGDEGQSSATLGGGMADDDGTGEGDGDITGGQDALAGIEIGVGEAFVAAEGVVGGEPFRREAGGD